MIKQLIYLTIMAILSLLMPILVHAEEEETKEEVKIIEKDEEKESILNNTKSINSDYCVQKNWIYKKTYYQNNVYFNTKKGNITGSEYRSSYIFNPGTYTISSNSTNSNPNNGGWYIQEDNNQNYRLLSRSLNYTFTTQYNFTLWYYSSNEELIKDILTSEIILTDGTCMTNEDYIEENTRNLVQLSTIGIGILIAIFLTRRN